MSYHFRKVIPALFSGICGNRCVDIAEVVFVCMNTHSPCFLVPPWWSTFCSLIGLWSNNLSISSQPLWRPRGSNFPASNKASQSFSSAPPHPPFASFFLDSTLYIFQTKGQALDFYSSFANAQISSFASLRVFFPFLVRGVIRMFDCLFVCFFSLLIPKSSPRRALGHQFLASGSQWSRWGREGPDAGELIY